MSTNVKLDSQQYSSLFKTKSSAIKVFSKKNQINYFTVHIFLAALFLLASDVRATDHEGGSFGLTSFAFASYLGTGFYTTSGQNVFVLQTPLEHIIKKKTDEEAGWVLKLPITIGFINFDNLKIEELPGINDVGTITFLPGIEYQYPITANWTVIPFADYGFARELDSTSNVLITGTGMKSYFDIHFDNAKFTLGNKFLFARERNKDFSSASSYSVLETGLNLSFNNNFSFVDMPVRSNFYYINFYYPNNLVFFEQTPNPIKIGIEHEVGFTISNMPSFLFFENPQIGIGVRFGNNINVYRIVFGAPF